MTALAALELSACARAPTCGTAGAFTDRDIFNRAVQIIEKKKASGTSTARSFDFKSLPAECCEVRRLQERGQLAPIDSNATAATYAVEINWPDETAFTKGREYIIYFDDCLNELDIKSM